MKMSRGINLHFRSGKYSNAAESYATQMSAENRAYIHYSKHLNKGLPNFVVKTASLRGHCVLPAQVLEAGKFCLEDQGLFVACTLARSH